MRKSPILVSACLAGIFCRYDGKTNANETILEMVRSGTAIPFCPEVHGGLPTPRPPCEIQGASVLDCHGNDCTNAFVRGAEEGLRLAHLVGCTEAILKARSPSCGSGIIYDGTFSGTRISGNGCFADLLMKNGIRVRSEETISSFPENQ
ncbi:DUF523 domain-containing protein [Pseudodesulfovibrio piezophilus]|uniref:Uncharacterized protein n=1 Tax=Pseudodesulfovibrio piezophilus (strain DSM 21447 / JCM 15486 / C1TLV30) TaxID=1322246 RepID=M1WKK7_PSEP2|nr:DUF523 domain-containing protein [Pseudodesulfovibrio piezophilus]CCH49771.1 conserved protein of unknown function [Pseudodesulfovibrio piezophilus C1TLV30]